MKDKDYIFTDLLNFIFLRTGDRISTCLGVICWCVVVYSTCDIIINYFYDGRTMSEQTVEIIISPDGSSIKTDASGFEGKQCIESITPILDALGETEHIEEKPEAHNKVGTSIRAGNG